MEAKHDILVSATKNKKRGRPRIADDNHRTLFYDYQDRAQTNMYYVVVAYAIISKTWGEDKFKAHFVNSTGKYKRQAILEQIGRMYLQNGYSESDCMQIVDIALNLLEKYTVKQVENWLRYCRNNDDWQL
jgi:hypothetical protein